MLIIYLIYLRILYYSIYDTFILYNLHVFYDRYVILGNLSIFIYNLRYVL
jgi:hypothetical protein